MPNLSVLRTPFLEVPPKGAIALEQIQQALTAGLPRGVVLADAAYGTEADWRDQLSAWNLTYAVAVRQTTQVWSGVDQPAATPRPSPRGCRPGTRLVVNARHKPLPVLTIAQQLPAGSYRTVTWREGAQPLRSRFAALRVRAAHERRSRAEEWLLIEWPRTAAEPVHYWLSTLPQGTSLKTLVATVMGRWRIERDYQELKSELGLHHYEGRNWRGFHHHASLCIAAYGFLMRERLLSKSNSARLKAPGVPEGFQPRGSGAHATAPPNFDRDDGVLSRPPDRSRASTLPLLRHTHAQTRSPLLTQ